MRYLTDLTSDHCLALTISSMIAASFLILCSGCSIPKKENATCLAEAYGLVPTREPKRPDTADILTRAAVDIVRCEMEKSDLKPELKAQICFTADVIASLRAEIQHPISTPILHGDVDPIKSFFTWAAIIWGIGLACIWLYLIPVWWSDRWELNHCRDEDINGYSWYFFHSLIWPFLAISWILLAPFIAVSFLRDRHLKTLSIRRNTPTIDELYKEINEMMEQEGIKD